MKIISDQFLSEDFLVILTIDFSLKNFQFVSKDLFIDQAAKSFHVLFTTNLIRQVSETVKDLFNFYIKKNRSKDFKVLLMDDFIELGWKADNYLLADCFFDQKTEDFPIFFVTDLI